MAAIDVYLQQILDAVYGEEVRHSIHDSIAAMNVESTNAEAAAISARGSASESATIATNAKNTAVSAKDDAVAAKVAAEAAAEQASQVVSGAVRYKGAITFANLPTTGMVNGDMYNITDSFTADNRFRAEDQGKTFKPGANVAFDPNSKWDVLGYQTGNAVPDGGSAGQLLLKRSSTNGDTEWTRGLYFFDTIAQMNAAISLGNVANGGICIVKESSGGTVGINVDDIIDVTLSNEATGDILMYDSERNLWVNVSHLTSAQKTALTDLLS